MERRREGDRTEGEKETDGGREGDGRRDRERDRDGETEAEKNPLTETKTESLMVQYRGDLICSL